MAEFKAIETQEQLDGIIQERLKRQAETLEKKFAEYLSKDDYNDKVEGFNLQISELNKSLEEERAKNGTYESQIAEFTKQIKTYERESVKNRISAEIGLPYELAKRLSGDTEEEIRKDAEALKSIFGKSTTTAPLATSEGNNNTQNADMRQMLRDLKGE